MALSREDVQKIATLARLDLSEDEITLYQEQLSAILAHAERLEQLDMEDVEPTLSVNDLSSVLREDILEPSLPVEDVLFNAPKKSGDRFKIQAILDET